MQDFDEIYSKYFSEVYKFVLSLCQNPALAEEITQETFFKAFKNIDRFKGHCKLSTWLCKIAKNPFYSYARKHSLRRRLYYVKTVKQTKNLQQIIK